eukprot:227980-Chlamydomonas_euryale.AAC.2
METETIHARNRNVSGECRPACFKAAQLSTMAGTPVNFRRKILGPPSVVAVWGGNHGAHRVPSSRTHGYAHKRIHTCGCVHAPALAAAASQQRALSCRPFDITLPTDSGCSDPWLPRPAPAAPSPPPTLPPPAPPALRSPSVTQRLTVGLPGMAGRTRRPLAPATPRLPTRCGALKDGDGLPCVEEPPPPLP